MSADEAMQPESTADELEMALPDDLEDAAKQQDSDFDSPSESDPALEDVAEPSVDQAAEDTADLEENAEPSIESVSEEDADVEATIAAASSEELSEDALEDSAENIATGASDANTSDISTSASTGTNEVAEHTAASEVTNESLANSSATLAENEAEGTEEVTEATAANTSAAESSAESAIPAQDSVAENVAAPPLTPSIPVQILQTVQTILSIVLPILRAVTVLTLKITIRVLQFVVDLLEAPKSEPAATSAQTPTSSANGTQAAQSSTWDPERTDAIAYSMADLTNAEMDDEDAEVKRVRFTIDDIYQDDGSLRPLPERLKEIWQDLIRVMRSPLPAAMNQQIPDRVFSFILAAVLAIVIWNLVTFILPSKPSPRPPQATKSQPTEVAKPSATEKSNTDTPTEPTQAPDIVQPAPAPTPTVQPTPAPTATPQLELEPRDTVIEAIQQQVSEVTQRYADNLIQSVQANFRDGRLTVRVSDDWYRLAASQQDQVATDLLKRTKSLDFGKLELLDSQDNRVARSPIVGNKMLILQRDRTDVTGPIPIGTTTQTTEPSSPESDAAEPEDAIPVTSAVTPTNEV